MLLCCSSKINASGCNGEEEEEEEDGREMGLSNPNPNVARSLNRESATIVSRISDGVVRNVGQKWDA